jgi:hypothetical protein
MAKKRKAAAVYMAPDELVPWPDNPRHNEDAVSKIAESIKELGFGAPVVAREQDNMIVAGHTRWLAAQQLGLAEIPVRLLPLTDEQFEKLAVADNRLGEIATWDMDKLDQVLEGWTDQGWGMEVAGFDGWDDAPLFDDDDDEIDGSGESLAGADPSGNRNAATGPGSRTPPAGTPDGKDEPRISAVDVPDALWATDNVWGVPVLDINLQADAMDQPVVRWGRISRKATMGGTWHFYTDDYKFSALWRDPSAVVNSGCVNVTEVNFSTADTMPRAAALWQVYRKRWLARYWQSKGIRVFVDLCVSNLHLDLNWLGVPKGWKAYSTRGYRAGLPDIKVQYDQACAHAGTTSLLFVVVGGCDVVRDACMEHGWLWLPEEADVARGRHAEEAAEFGIAETAAVHAKAGGVPSPPPAGVSDA